MKPISLKLQAFGPYREKAEVDFSRLNQAAFFLISGPTGGGKTSILDAMCFALYCRATGGKRDFKSMRCNTADSEEATRVEFVFELGDEEYRFERTLLPHTNRNTGEESLNGEHACYSRKTGDEDWTLIKGSKSEGPVREYAENLLHLTCKQFSQVIVLPQGDFMQFLRASSKEKSDMLKTLFSVEIWEMIAKNAALRAARLKEEVQKKRAVRESHLTQAGHETPEELSEEKENAFIKMKAAEKESIRIAAETEKADKELESARTYIRLKEEFTKAQEHLKQTAVKFTAASQSMEKAGEMTKQKEEFRAEAVSMAQQSEKILNRQEQLKKAIKIRQEAAEKREQAVKHETLGNAEKEKTAELEERMKSGKEFLENSREAARQLPELTGREAELRHGLERRQELEKLRQKLNKSMAEHKRLGERREKERLILESLSLRVRREENIRIHGQAFVLAQELKQGEPCPVCGSAEHPLPAEPAEKAMTRQEFEKLKQEEKNAEKALVKTRITEERAASDIEETEKQVKEQERLCAGFSEKSIEETAEKLAELTQQLKAAEGAQNKLAAAEQKLEKLRAEREDRISRQKECFEKANILLAEAKAQEEPFSDERIEDQKRLEQELSAELSEKLKKRVLLEKQAAELEKQHESMIREFSEAKAGNAAAQNSYDKAHEAFEQVKGSQKEMPQPDKLEERCKTLRQESQGCAERLGNNRSAVASLEKTIKTVAELDDALKELDREYETTERIAGFMSGSNPLRTPILMYVLSIMMDEILVSANQFFDKLSRGRYALNRVRDKQGGNALRGLDIEIVDGGMSARPVETLSGGEQFLASLSLAFGLSDVVQQHSGAVKLDSLFIDEGFGSLDTETLDVAMQALVILRESGRTVGIISHVTELKSRIPTRLEVCRNGANQAGIRIIAE